MARGLDLGSASAVAASRSGAGPVFTRARSVYVALAAGRRTEASLREAGIHAVPWNGRILVLGDEAARVAMMQGAPDDLRQPLADGVLARGDAEGEQVLALLASQLLGGPALRGEHLGLTLPGNADDHHRRVLTQLAEPGRTPAPRGGDVGGGRPDPPQREGPGGGRRGGGAR